MSAKVVSDIAANARAKLERLQKSSKYRSFLTSMLLMLLPR